MSKAISIQEAEAKIPELAKNATKSAFRRVLASGNSVLISKDGEIRRVFPDGKFELVKVNVPAFKTSKGTIIKIK